MSYRVETKPFLAFILVFLINNIMAQNNIDKKDEIYSDDKSVELPGVQVNGQSVFMEGNKIIFIPSKKNKNLAKDLSSLIDLMNLGVVVVNNGNIKTSSGENVNIFINGEKSDEIDLSTFWPKNVLKIEFMEFSDNPSFEGSKNILNVIVKQYIAGGLTRIMADQVIPLNGNYSTASKLVVKKLTFNLMFKGGYLDDHFNNSYSSSNMDNIWYNGIHYDNMNITEQSSATERNENLYGGLNARFKNGDYSMVHSISYQWNHNPNSFTQGLKTYSPDIIDSDYFKYYTTNLNLSPVVKGQYMFNSLGKWNFSLLWNFKYFRNNYYSSYDNFSTENIINYSKEKNFSGGITLYSLYNLRKNMVFQFYVQYSNNFINIDYNRNSADDQTLKSHSSQVMLDWWYNPITNLYFDIVPSISLKYEGINILNERIQWLPSFQFRTNYSINKKNRISLFYEFKNYSPSMKEMNDVIIRQNDLMWIQGTPYLECQNINQFTINYNCYPSFWFNSVFNINYFLSNNQYGLDYRSGGPEYDGVIGKFRNIGKIKSLNIGWDTSFTLFNGNFRYVNSLSYNKEKSNWGYHISYFAFNPKLTWLFGNCGLIVNYSTPVKSIADAGMKLEKDSDWTSIMFKYGNGDFNISISAEHVFRRKIKTESVFKSGPYQDLSFDFKRGLCFNISLYYTFDYGKKITPGIEIYEEEGTKSSSIIN